MNGPGRRRGVVVLVVAAFLALAATNDPMLDRQWYLGHVGVFDAWQEGTGSGVVVAVLDTGVDRDHPDLRGQVMAGVDLVDRGSRPDDANGHGTLVAGIIAAVADNSVGIAGAAPDSRILPVRVLDDDGAGQSSDMAEGIRWAADNGADIINLSLAEVDVDRSERASGDLVTSQVEEAIRYAERQDVVVVAAAGNEGRTTTPYSANSPALVVGASDHADRVWRDSNRDSRTLFAPGVEITSTWRDEGYAKADGTSFAAPIVSGGAAILRERGLPASMVMDRLRDTATDIGAGVGLVDLAAAVDVERTGDPTPPPAPTDDRSRRTPEPVEAVTPTPAPTASPTPGLDDEVLEEPTEDQEQLVLGDVPAQQAPSQPLPVEHDQDETPPWLAVLVGALIAGNMLAVFTVFLYRRLRW